MTVDTYTFTGDYREVNKSLGTSTVYSCELKKATNYMDLVLILTTNDDFVNLPFNYVVLNRTASSKNFSQRRRGYYVDWSNTRNVARGVWEVALKLDVRYTYANEIMSSEQVIDRNENDYNLYLQDNMYAKRAYPLTQCVSEFTGFTNDYTYIVNTVAKGGASNE